MSREQLHGIVANLKRYLEWQGVLEPGMGVPAAPAALREAFEAQKAERESARLHAARDAISGGSAEPSRAPAPVVSRPSPAPEPQTPTPTPEKTPETTKPETSGGTAPWVKYGPRARKTFGSNESAAGAQASPPTGPPTSDEPPPPEYDGPPVDEPSYDESYGYDDSAVPTGPASFGYPPHGAGTIEKFDANKFGWHAGKFRAPQEPDGGFSPADKLAILRMYMGDCTRCGLCEGRTNLVFGDGSPSARLMFVGEGPGYNEDQQAKPFVGKAGQLLDKMIGAMGFGRADVYIANVVKCRPPDNRDPAPDEVAACSPFLHKQIDAIQPDVIVTLGKFAAHNLLGVDTPISRMRGQWHEFKGIPVMPTWHPAYLLRNEGEKRNAWSDLQQVMTRLQ